MEKGMNWGRDITHTAKGRHAAALERHIDDLETQLAARMRAIKDLRALLRGSEARVARLQPVVDAAEALVDKLNTIFGSDAYVAVFQMSENHGLKYDGPFCTDEFAAAQKVVNTYRNGAANAT